VFPKELKENNVRRGFIEDEEFALLTANANQLWLQTFLEIAYTWGWRVSEILSRRVRHVDLHKRIIRLDPGETKNDQGRECIMTGKIYELVKQCIDGKQRDDFLLTRTQNRPVKTFRGTWATLCRSIGRPNLLKHDLRRSAARALRNAGVAESVIMETGGWSTASVFRRYAIVPNKDKAPAMAELEQKRIADRAKREAQEADISHNFSHNLASDNESQSTARREVVQ